MNHITNKLRVKLKFFSLIFFVSILSKCYYKDRSNQGSKGLVSYDHLDLIHIESCLAINPWDNNNLVITCMVFDEKDINPELAIYSSQDGGEAWNLCYLSESPYFVGDPWVTFTANNHVLVTCLNLKNKGGISMLRSNDHGKNWKISDDLSKFNGSNYDHPVIVPFKSNIAIIASQSRTKINQKSNDVNMVFLSDQLVVDTFIIYTEGLKDLMSGKGGLLTDSTLLIPVIEIGDNSKGHQEIIEHPILSILRVDHHSFETDLIYLDTLSGMGSFPTLAIDNHENSKFLNFVYVARHLDENGRKLAFWRSLDAGKHWERVDVGYLNDHKEEIWNAHVEVNKNGIVGLAWQAKDSRDSVFHYFSYSLDGGKTFAKKIQISGLASFNETPAHNAVVFKNGRTLANRYHTGGDYFGMCTNKNGEFCFSYSRSYKGKFQLYFSRWDPKWKRRSFN